VFPSNHLIQLWDLPGAGTEDFKAAEYTKKMEFNKFDAFVLLSSERFTEIDKMIANEIQMLGKPYFFARTKMDDAMRNQKRTLKRKFDPKKEADKIRADCQKHLRVSSSTKIFLIANLPDDDLRKDFPQNDNDLLKIEIINKLPDIQKHSLVFALTCNSEAMIDIKVEELSKRFLKLALISGAGRTVPIPGVSAGIDLAILTEEAFFQKKQLGIDSASIKEKAEIFNLSNEHFLREVEEELQLTSYFEKTIFRTMFLAKDEQSKAMSAALTTNVAISEAVEMGVTLFIPLVGPAISGAVSGGATYWMLTQMLNAHALTAKRVSAVVEEMAANTMK